MSEEQKKKTTHETDKSKVHDLKPGKDPKGGGGLKPVSGGTGGTTTQPVGHSDN